MPHLISVNMGEMRDISGPLATVSSWIVILIFNRDLLFSHENCSFGVRKLHFDTRVAVLERTHNFAFGLHLVIKIDLRRFRLLFFDDHRFGNYRLVVT